MNQQQQIEAHRARVARRKARDSDTVTIGLDEMHAILQQHGVDVSMDEMLDIIESGVPLTRGRHGLQLNVPAFVEDVRDLVLIHHAVERQERQEADEDRAFSLLLTVGTLDELIARGLIDEDAKRGITMTPAGWALVKSLGWEADP